MSFFVTILFIEGTEHRIRYGTVDECLLDSGLQALFDDGVVEKCEIWRNEQRITGIPKILATWDQFQDRIKAHQKTLDS